MPPAAPVGAIFCEKGERARPAPPPACWLARLLSGDTDEDLRQKSKTCLWPLLFLPFIFENDLSVLSKSNKKKKLGSGSDRTQLLQHGYR
jgi:hypothetical protein